MPEQERVERHQYMSECVTRFSAQHWADDLVTELLTQDQDHSELLTHLTEPTALPLQPLLEAYKNSSRRLIVLGTLHTPSLSPGPKPDPSPNPKP